MASASQAVTKKRTPAKANGASKNGKGAVKIATKEEIAANAKVAKTHLRTVQTHLSAVEQSFYKIGKALLALRAPAMWGALGHASFEELVGTIPLSLPVAYRWVRIAENYGERTALKLTQSKAAALLTYVDATSTNDDAESLARKDAKVNGTRISAQTVRGILEAAADARPDDRQRKRPGEDVARKAASKLAKVLVSRTKDDVSVRTVFRRGAFRLVLDIPLELADGIVVKAK
jgi:hypothetical protein